LIELISGGDEGFSITKLGWWHGILLDFQKWGRNLTFPTTELLDQSSKDTRQFS
jgi:hypothetical protein